MSERTQRQASEDQEFEETIERLGPNWEQEAAEDADYPHVGAGAELNALGLTPEPIPRPDPQFRVTEEALAAAKFHNWRDGMHVAMHLQGVRSECGNFVASLQWLPGEGVWAITVHPAPAR